MRIDGFKTYVAWRKVEFFIESRVVGYMHLPIFARNGPIGIEHNCRVMIQTSGTLFEERRHNNHSQISSQRRKECGGGAWYGFGIVEQSRIFRLAEVGRVV